MVSVVNLDDEMGDGKLQLMRPEPPCLVARCEFQVRPEIEQDVCGLRDNELAGLEERRGEGGCAPPLLSRNFIIAGTPLLPLRRATSI